MQKSPTPEKPPDALLARLEDNQRISNLITLMQLERELPEPIRLGMLFRLAEVSTQINAEPLKSKECEERHA